MMNKSTQDRLDEKNASRMKSESDSAELANFRKAKQADEFERVIQQVSEASANNAYANVMNHLREVVGDPGINSQQVYQEPKNEGLLQDVTSGLDSAARNVSQWFSERLAEPERGSYPEEPSRYSVQAEESYNILTEDAGVAAMDRARASGDTSDANINKFMIEELNKRGIE